MKTNLPQWLTPFVSPVMIFLAVVTPVLKVLDFVDPKNALGIAVAVTLIAASWSFHAWTTRLTPAIYGSTTKRYRFNGWVRYGSLVGLATCLVATVFLGLTAFKAVPTKPVHSTLPFSIYNGSPTTPIWMPTSADIQVLAPQTWATDQVVVSVSARVDMPNVFKFGGQPQVDPDGSEIGIIKLPEKFDLQQYVERGLKIRLLIQVEPSGKLLHSDILLDDSATREGFKLAYEL